ncbi:hypothetical protein JJL56_01625 [Azospirillum sp. YIM DDC1]|uniref:Uncharacterized protein n=1 Tax=Azospirillum aestuarii TaxID=2802052 RepID=A0ABS1HRW7_9PROT|nr:hypothetical protein [Azospirillum aestuarii]MBK4717560.1 hypothetical protein [Azospirillum aestuarii]
METPLESASVAARAALVILETLPSRMETPRSIPILMEACNILCSAIRVLDEGNATEGTLPLVAHIILQAARALEVNEPPMNIPVEDRRLAVVLLWAQARKIMDLHAEGVP